MFQPVITDRKAKISLDTGEIVIRKEPIDLENSGVVLRSDQEFQRCH